MVLSLMRVSTRSNLISTSIQTGSKTMRLLGIRKANQMPGIFFEDDKEVVVIGVGHEGEDPKEAKGRVANDALDARIAFLQQYITASECPTSGFACILDPTAAAKRNRAGCNCTSTSSRRPTPTEKSSPALSKN